MVLCKHSFEHCGLDAEASVITYVAPELVEVSVVVEYGYSFSDPIIDEEEGWD